MAERDNNDSWGAEWTRVVDVIAVGSGAAALTAAWAAAKAGSQVLVLERAAFTGGTSAKSSTTIWIPNNRFMRARGVADPREDALRYMAKSAYPTKYNASHPTLGLPEDRYRLLETYYDTASLALDDLLDSGVQDIAETFYPDYYAEMPEDRAPIGRSLRPTVWPGHRRGIDPGEGQIFINRLQEAFVKLGGEVQLNSRVVNAIRDADGNVVGVEVRVGHRSEFIGARQGIVFGTGGFLHNEKMAQAYLRGPVMGGAAVEGSQGDFARIGMQLGAQLGNMTHAWWCQSLVELVAKNRATLRDVYVPYGDSMFMVNRYGVRALNEKAPYNERGQAHFTWDATRLEYPNYLMFWVFDDVLLNGPLADDPRYARHRFPMPPRGETREYIISAPDWKGLVAGIRERLAMYPAHTGGVTLAPEFEANLAKTLDRFNAMAAEGKDLDFGRGNAAIDRFWSQEARPGAKAGWMHPLADKGPYHCIILGPGALDTKGGPVVDERSRVLSMEGEPIDGVYAAGNCAASPAGQAYWGAGGTVGVAMTFGWIAGRELARRERRKAVTLAG